MHCRDVGKPWIICILGLQGEKRVRELTLVNHSLCFKATGHSQRWLDVCRTLFMNHIHTIAADHHCKSSPRMRGLCDGVVDFLLDSPLTLSDLSRSRGFKGSSRNDDSIRRRSRIRKIDSLSRSRSRSLSRSPVIA